MGIFKASEAEAVICCLLLAVPGTIQRCCVGPACGAWRWSELADGAGGGYGYCGLAGEPININHQQAHETAYQKHLLARVEAAAKDKTTANGKAGKGGK